MVNVVTREQPAVWWASSAEEAEDTRIPALATDATSYVFSLEAAKAPVVVRATLIFRKFFQAWVDMKKWDDMDFIMAAVTDTLPAWQPGAQPVVSADIR